MVVTTDHAIGLPVLRAFSPVYMPSPLPRHADWVRSSLASPAIPAFPIRVDQSARASSFSRLAQRSLTLRPAHSPSHLVTLYTRGFSHFVTSMTAPIASGWSDSCRVGLAPTEEHRLITAHTLFGRSRRLYNLTSITPHDVVGVGHVDTSGPPSTRWSMRRALMSPPM